MTLEELKNKKVNITLNNTFLLGDDLDEDSLQYIIERQEKSGCSDEELIKDVIDLYYGSMSDIADTVDYPDFDVNIL